MSTLFHAFIAIAWVSVSISVDIRGELCWRCSRSSCYFRWCCYCIVFISPLIAIPFSRPVISSMSVSVALTISISSIYVSLGIISIWSVAILSSTTFAVVLPHLLCLPSKFVIYSCTDSRIGCGQAKQRVLCGHVPHLMYILVETMTAVYTMIDLT